MKRTKNLLAHPLTILTIALSAYYMYAQGQAQQPPRPDGLSCTVEVLTAPHGASQHGPMVRGGSYRAEVKIDPGVYGCVDERAVWHITPFRPKDGACRRQ